MAQSEEQCCASVRNGSGFGFHNCWFRGKHEHEGKRYCGNHYPPTMEKRRQKQEARWAEERAADALKWERKRFDLRAGEACHKIGIKDPETVIPELVKIAEVGLSLVEDAYERGFTPAKMAAKKMRAVLAKVKR